MEHIQPPDSIVPEPDRAVEAYDDLNRGYPLLASAAVPGAMALFPELLAGPPPAASPRPDEGPRRDTGRCTEKQHAKLQDEVNRECKQSPTPCRGPSAAELNDCVALRVLLELNRASLRQKQRCLVARGRIRNQCFPEPRPEVPEDQEKWEGHRAQSQQVLNSIKDCKAKISLVERRLEEVGCP